MSVNEQALSSDEETLHRLGYAQELRRRMSGFSNFAVSFTIISILSGCLTLYGYGMNTGGPAIIVWGWPIVGIMTLLVGLSMAEVCSSFPTAGGLYYWSAKLARTQRRRGWSWFTGWFNFLGQVAITAGIDFGAAFFINAFAEPGSSGRRTQHWVTILIYAIVLLVHGAAEPVRHPAGRAAERRQRLVAHPRRADHRRRTGVRAGPPRVRQVRVHRSVNVTGFTVVFYVLLLGLLLAQYTFTGYDASAHMTEETHNAARSGPRGIVMSILVSLIAGWILLIGITFAIQKTN